jgi:hypothetical protein
MRCPRDIAAAFGFGAAVITAAGTAVTVVGSGTAGWAEGCPDEQAAASRIAAGRIPKVRRSVDARGVGMSL